MHELSVAIELYRACRTELESRGGGRLEGVTVAIGELAGVDPQLLRLAWPSVVADGPDRDASIEIDWRPATQTCADCGPVRERQPGTWLRLCPACGAPLSVNDASELDLVNIAYVPGALAPTV